MVMGLRFNAPAPDSGEARGSCSAEHPEVGLTCAGGIPFAPIAGISPQSATTCACSEKTGTIRFEVGCPDAG